MRTTAQGGKSIYQEIFKWFEGAWLYSCIELAFANPMRLAPRLEFGCQFKRSKKATKGAKLQLQECSLFWTPWKTLMVDALSSLWMLASRIQGGNRYPGARTVQRAERSCTARISAGGFCSEAAWRITNTQKLLWIHKDHNAISDLWAWTYSGIAYCAKPTLKHPPSLHIISLWLQTAKEIQERHLM